MPPIQSLPKQTNLTEPGNAVDEKLPSPIETTELSESEKEEERVNETTELVQIEVYYKERQCL